jgi:hypothetical protein
MDYLETVKKISYDSKQILHNLQLPNNPGIVFDIDDTLICANSGGSGLFFGDCIDPIIDLYNTAKGLGIKPIIITARSADNAVVLYTLDMLKNCKINGFYSLYFRPIYMNNIIDYKTNARRHAVDSGINIVMSVGDQYWDMGSYGGIPVKLPSLT